ncbi:30S ribosomal protein S5 [Coxiella endosymbiont of Amblyomma nuttalli]|uniref:30S ribosomal protein S5 n=1 Tax=Coxiella endosymbiont of Amblyomma nuttalli TaxID=2749996 RepID=UPI001BAA687B|nr:30S ribosomal protein S5 [Coxiella endosymbiont of Amblyomma nuttalli]QTS83808.1 30S ribosomal protein S5 [Coxiella endosymbiont of Amblyomma nuttalli]
MQEAGTDTITDGIQDKLVEVRRTAKVVKGGRVFGFSALVVAGDGEGKVGFGLGKAREVPVAIQKATESARRNMISVHLRGNTLHHSIKASHVSSTVLMLPASEGTGVIAGNAMRAIFEVMGVQNVLSKCIGSSNPINVVRATFKGLKTMETPESVAAKRGKVIQEITE